MKIDYDDAVILLIKGEAKAKPRVRFTKKGHAYNKKWVKSFGEVVKLLYMSQAKGEMFVGALDVLMVVHRQMPNSWSAKKKKDLCGSVVQVRPDNDNYEKMYWDHLNGVAWRDDGQIVFNATIKVYDYEPSVEIVIQHHQAENKPW